MGIREATGEIVMITDADIAVEPGWVYGHLRAFGDDIGMVGSTTRVDTSSGRIFHKLQNCELINMLAVAMGFAGLGLPFTVMGNNTSFRMQAYRDVGGYEAMRASVVEDMALMNAIVTGTPLKIGWATDPGAVATSMPERDFTTLINQRRRWLIAISGLFRSGKFAVVTEMLMVLSLIAAVAVLPWQPRAFIGVTAAWCAGSGLIISASQGYRRGDMIRVPGTLLFRVGSSAVLVARKFFGAKQIVWKDRVYDGV